MLELPMLNVPPIHLYVTLVNIATVCSTTSVLILPGLMLLHHQVAHSPENLDVQVAAVIYRDLVAMTQKEKELRKSLMQMVRNARSRCRFLFRAI